MRVYFPHGLFVTIAGIKYMKLQLFTSVFFTTLHTIFLIHIHNQISLPYLGLFYHADDPFSILPSYDLHKDAITLLKTCMNASTSIWNWYGKLVEFFSFFLITISSHKYSCLLPLNYLLRKQSYPGEQKKLPFIFRTIIMNFSTTNVWQNINAMPLWPGTK